MGLNYEPTLGHESRAGAGNGPTARAAPVPPPNRRFRPSYGAVAAINQSLVVFPLLVTVWLFIDYTSVHQIAVDFHNDFWVAGYRVLHGLSPYDWTRHQIAGLVSFPYPAPAALVFVPFALLPRGLADLIFVALSIAERGAKAADLSVVRSETSTASVTQPLEVLDCEVAIDQDHCGPRRAHRRVTGRWA